LYEITAVRLKPADDGEHMHVDLVGYDSPHIPGEQILIPVERVIQRMALGEKFGVRTGNGDEVAEVQPAKCPLCGHEPYLKTTADTPDRQLLLELPEE
jgi:hypothetical protein